ncbi:TIGR03643 family protein [Flavobacterium inviolabile]|uniref:TIGR03643 family protein n=1 Tax=Flavobacterium inviolabile TaxID=2748320 RepID=UPI0015B31A02|nr:TIGR03643 family protein [Flavobacterium inviolabile]
MKKSKVLEFDKETIDRIVAMAQEERKPFEVLKEEFGISESEVTEMVRKKLSKDNFELWKKKVAANKPKPKPQKYNELEDDDLDSKYYFKNKFD